MAPGISWIYLKDMTHYMSFWKSPQKIIFDLGNLISAYDLEQPGSFGAILNHPSR